MSMSSVLSTTEWELTEAERAKADARVPADRLDSRIRTLTETRNGTSARFA
jgi:hypothetical protein